MMDNKITEEEVVMLLADTLTHSDEFDKLFNREHPLPFIEFVEFMEKKRTARNNR